MIPIENVHDLEIFQCVVARRSFSGAAHELGITQPAVSLAIGRLERQLGTTLFNRQNTGASNDYLTDTGAVLAAHAAQAIDELSVAVQAITEMEGRRPVRIGLPPIIARHFFPTGLDCLVEAYEDHPVEILSFGSERMLANIEHHRIDVGMIASEQEALNLPRVRFSRVASFPFRVAVSQQMANELQGEVDIAWLETTSTPLISFTGDFVQREALVAAFEHSGYRLHVSAETDQPDMMRRLVAANMGMGIASSITFEKWPEDVRLLPLTGAGSPRFNVFVFEDISRVVRPETSVITAIKRQLFMAAQRTRPN